jgi:hypothetical protein
MAVDKFSGNTPILAILTSRVTLEDTLARFDQQVSRLPPEVFRSRLKRGLADVQVNINGCEDD